MAQTVEEIQNALINLTGQLEAWENAYNEAYSEASSWYALYDQCDSRGILYNCKRNLGYSKSELWSKSQFWYRKQQSAKQRIEEIMSQMSDLQNQLSGQIEITQELSETEVILSSNQSLIDSQQQEIAVSMLKTYAVPILVVVLVFFGIYMLRQKR